jgi:hypothetical protein
VKHSPLQGASPSAKGWWWASAGVALAAIGVAVWPHAQPAADSPAAGAQTGTQAWGSPSPFALPASGVPASAAIGAGPSAAAKPGAGAPAWAAASQPLLPPVETPSESLRKVQLALGGGMPEDALAAGQALQFCAHAAAVADSMHQGRDLAPLAPPEIRKALDKLGAVTNEQIDRAEQERRRCQVFDAATLSRAGELLRKAYEGGAPGAATPYLSWLQGDGKGQATPALVATLQAQVRAAIEAGEMTALVPAAFGSASDLGATPVQGQAYREAWLRISDELNPGSAAATKTLLDSIDQLRHAAPLTAEQQREADALAQKIVDAWHARMHKGG